MIGFIQSFLAMFALFVAPFAGWVSYRAYRENERHLALKSGAVFIVALLLWVGAPKVKIQQADNCFVDWDGRANPTVCD